MVIAKNQGRRWELVEQACLIRELQDRHKMSQEKIASMLGRNKSWVSRRISLVSTLPEQILDWVLSGHISTWAATRVLVPLARANKEHAIALAKDLIKEHNHIEGLNILDYAEELGIGSKEYELIEL